MRIFASLSGTFVNCALIIAGTLVGLVLKKGIPKKHENMLMTAIGLTVLLIGINGLKQSNNTIVLTLSMVIGALVGSLIDIDKWVNLCAKKVELKLNKGGENTLANGFITATMIFVIGGMAVVGSLNSGIKLNHEVLYSKGLIDGITSAVLASALGYGVMFSALPALVYQGTITLLASTLQPLLTSNIVGEMSAVGSLLIVAIALNMLKVTNIKVMNMLPTIFIPILLYQIPFFA